MPHVLQQCSDETSLEIWADTLTLAWKIHLPFNEMGELFDGIRFENENRSLVNELWEIEILIKHISGEVIKLLDNRLAKTSGKIAN
jgi:hypothetical protein